MHFIVKLRTKLMHFCNKYQYIRCNKKCSLMMQLLFTNAWYLWDRSRHSFIKQYFCFSICVARIVLNILLFLNSEFCISALGQNLSSAIMLRFQQQFTIFCCYYQLMMLLVFFSTARVIFTRRQKIQGKSRWEKLKTILCLSEKRVAKQIIKNVESLW